MPLSTPPLALYVHFPWCVRKCPYCDFNSYALRDRLPEDRYVEALIHDLESQARTVRERATGEPRALISVFLGGGTPSLFSPAAIARVLETARGAFAFADDIEVTLEANPGAIERGRFSEYRAAGINRVSLGAQSFDAQALRALGRIHSPQETCRAAEELHAAGLDNFNLDLMYALPAQDIARAVADVERAIALAPAHVSHYQLTLEPGTLFAARQPELPSDEVAADMLAACQARLGAAGYEQYEISAYARPGRMARHNCNYWNFGDYVGIGAGAHGKLTDPERACILRTAHAREPRRYMAAAAGPLVEKPIVLHDRPFEFMLNALRLTRGFERSLFEMRTGLEWRTVAPILQELEAQGLVRHADRLWAATELGARFLNELLLRFLPSERASRSGAWSAQAPPATRAGVLSTGS